MAVYTRKGDTGTTSMYEADPKKRCRVSKSDLRVQAIGAVDEVNSYLGICNFYVQSSNTKKFVTDIQRNLFTIGSILSKAPLEIKKAETKKLEGEIDRIEESLPPLRNFLLPEGSISAVHFMYARALARRAERRVVALHNKEAVDSGVLEYINRLSDYLFCIFREENALSGEKEELWIGRKS